MIKPSFAFALALGALLLLSGCVNLSHDAKQVFNEDGSSVMTITHELSLSKEALGMFEASIPSGEQSYNGVSLKYVRMGIRLVEKMFDAYSFTMCDLAKGAECKVGSDGQIVITAQMKPNTDFYAFSKETDWVALKETSTYEIQRVPTAFYFAAEGKSGKEFGQTLLKTYVGRITPEIKSEIEQTMTENFVCFSTYPYTCEVVKSAGSSATFKLAGSSYSSDKLKWAACSEYDEDAMKAKAGVRGYFASLNESQALGYVQRPTYVNSMVGSDGQEVRTDCSAKSKALVLATESESYNYYASDDEDSTTMETSLEFIPLYSKEAIMANISQNLEKLDTESAFAPALDRYGANLSFYLINFQDGKISNEDIRFLNETMGDNIEMMSKANLKASLSYEARFPGTVVSAKVQGQDVPLDGNGFKLNLQDMARLGKGTIIVKTERSLSPLGIYTWIIPIGIVVLLALFAILKMAAPPKHGPEQAP